MTLELEDTKLNTEQCEKIVTPKHSNVVFFISTILQLVVGTILYVPLLLVLMVSKVGNEDKIYYYYISPFVQFIAVFMPVAFYFLIFKIDYKKALRLNKIKLRHIIPFILIGISAQFVGGFLNNFIIIILQQFGKVPISEIPVPSSPVELGLAIFSIALMPAVFEETLGRGLILRGYEGYGVKWGIIASALLFGIMHYDLENFIFPIFFGLILAYVVYRTNSLFAGMIIHFTNNALATILLYFAPTETEKYYPQITLNDFISYSVAAVVGLIFLAGGIYYINRTTSPESPSVRMTEKQSFSNVLASYWPIFISLVLLTVFFSITVIEVVKS